MRRNPNYFNVNKHVKICSEHFSSEEFINPDAKKRRLQRSAVPSVFAWSKESPETISAKSRIYLTGYHVYIAFLCITCYQSALRSPKRSCSHISLVLIPMLT